MISKGAIREIGTIMIIITLFLVGCALMCVPIYLAVTYENASWLLLFLLVGVVGLGMRKYAEDG